MLKQLKLLVNLSILSYLLVTLTSVFTPGLNEWVYQKGALCIYRSEGYHEIVNLVSTQFDALDEKYNVQSKYEKYLEPSFNGIRRATCALSERLEVEGRITSIHNSYINLLKKFKIYLDRNFIPMLIARYHHVKLVIYTKAKLLLSWSVYQADTQYVLFCSFVKDKYILLVEPKLIPIKRSRIYIYLSYYLQQIADVTTKLFDVNTLQEKRAFLNAEFRNLMALWPEFSYSYKKKEDKKKIKVVVEDILSSSEPTVATVESELEDEEISGRDKKQNENDVENKYKERDESLALNSIEDSLVVRELKFFESKVNKTLNMAYSSLKDDMSPFIDSKIEIIKPKISEILTDMQTKNYKLYRKMNELISKIDKDSSDIKEFNKIINSEEDSGREFVHRQDMRDYIKRSREFTAEKTSDAEKILKAAHAEVMKKYFAVVQDTIDVVESFAESSVNEFSYRLNELLSLLEHEQGFDEKIGWNAWKRFHAVKEEIYSFRDKLFNEANAYQNDTQTETPPEGLKPWNVYMNKINFHNHFLLHDNEEYLRLVRAKANVAYQLRESLNRQLERLQEKSFTSTASEQTVHNYAESTSLVDKSSMNTYAVKVDETVDSDDSDNSADSAGSQSESESE